jgi:hypothetical protein
MTRVEALKILSDLARGLAPDAACVHRLMERIAERDEATDLRAFLVELGARALLKDTA